MNDYMPYPSAGVTIVLEKTLFGKNVLHIMFEKAKRRFSMNIDDDSFNHLLKVMELAEKDELEIKQHDKDK